MWGNILILVGVITFLAGYYFKGKADGQNDCGVGKPKDHDTTDLLGISGIAIGIILVIIGGVMKMMGGGSSNTAAASSE
ncbi:hypothetical protein EB118_02135 [bacterium]|nr:hypothetical protein [bacterium]